MMARYASATRTRRNLCALLRHGWGLCVSAAAQDGYRPGWPYMLDNGAWSCFQQGADFDEAAFAEAVERYGVGADFVVAPDIIGDGLSSLEMSARWLPWVLQRARRVVIGVQEGVTPADVRDLRHDRVGVAIGGATRAWKEEQTASRRWVGRGPLHVFRCANSERQMVLAYESGATSVDGNAARFAVNIPRLTRAATNITRQEALWAS